MSNNLIFGSTKTYTHNTGFSCCFRQWKAKSHCNMLHGYALQIEVKFEGVLDDKHWVLDFGSLKPFKAWLESMFDHTTIVAEDDPLKETLCDLGMLKLADIRLVKATGCEAFSKLIFDWLNEWLLSQEAYRGRVGVQEVVVREHAGNSGYTRLRGF